MVLHVRSACQVPLKLERKGAAGERTADSRSIAARYGLELVLARGNNGEGDKHGEDVPLSHSKRWFS